VVKKPPPAQPLAAPVTKRRGRPKGPIPRAPVSGFRIPLVTLARLDAIVELRAKELAPRGGSTSRSALVIAAVEEFCDREERLLAEAQTAKPRA
jgi:hypothetical protein